MMNLNRAIVLKNYPISTNTFLMELKVKLTPPPLPTQFVLLDTYPYRYLLKPFTVVCYKNNILTIIYRILSDGTKFLSTLIPNNEINILGPFGNTEILKKFKFNKNNNIAIIAGGSGVACVVFLYKYLYKKCRNIIVYYGERNKKYIINLSRLGINKVIYATDDGSYGEKGLVRDVFITKTINKVDFDYIFLCGPKSMIKSFSEVFQELKNTNCYVLMEEYMCCGVGVCRSCVVKTKLENNSTIYQTVCKDGPLFDLWKIVL
ncbi:MAG: hypothetical protein N2Z73_02075 [Endomicrobia bacterium]|nr:hypothetical protein [Endomicrobiia bacterium]